MSERYLHPEAIVSSALLEEHLEDPELRLYECTMYLDPPIEGVDAPYTVRNAKADFDAGHIAGASLIDLQADLSDAASPSHLRFMMPASPGALGAAFARLGVSDDSRVVLYSRVSSQWATRVWWLLRAIGFDNAAVLEGGWERWSLDGRPTSTDSRTYPAGQLSVRPRPVFVGKDAVQEAMGDGASCILNALSPDLHRGENARYGRPGRIPGSVNVPALSLLDEKDKTFLPAEKVAASFRAVGAQTGGRNIVYCGGGIAATLDAFLMYQLGYEDIAIYDASMSEWARDETLPIETG